MKLESQQAVEQTKQRIEMVKTQKKLDEERRAEQEKKLKEAQEKAEVLIKELLVKVDSAEELVKTLTTTAEAFDTNMTKMSAIGLIAVDSWF